MGRLSKSSTTTTTTTTGRRLSFRVHYSKLVDEYNSNNCDDLKFLPSFPEYLSYCCHQCGHTQKLQVRKSNKLISFSFLLLLWKKFPY